MTLEGCRGGSCSAPRGMQFSSWLAARDAVDQMGMVRVRILHWLGRRGSVCSTRQKSRRFCHIGQPRPVKAVFMACRNALQADALKLVAKKLQSSLAVEGELPEDGLAAFGDDGDDLMLALARQIVSGEEADADSESVEQVFAQARDAEATSEEYLVDDGWQAAEAGPELEPVVVEVHTNGHAIEPVTFNENGHHDEPAEGQQSLFSWAEFLAGEPAQPQGRNGKPKPSSRSLFEWALSAEQEREKELVGAGR